MAELTDQQESPVGEKVRPPRSRGGFWFGATVLLLVFGLAGAGFFLFTQLRAKQENLGGEVKNEMSKQLGGYQSQLSGIQNQMAALQAEIANKDAHFSKTVTDFAKMHDEKLGNTRKELNDAITLLQRQMGKTRGDWLIADAEYLLSVANERLYLIGDVNTTRQALEAADQRLRESGDALAFKVRDQVIKDIAALADIKPVDTVGLYSSLQVLEDRINHLTLLLPYADKSSDATSKPASEAAAPEEASQDDASIIEAAKDKLSQIVTIKHSDQNVKEILTPEQARFIRDQLRVKLEVVKMALVQQNEALYRVGLDDAKKWLEQQFDQNTEYKAFVGELNRYKGTKLRSQFPDISLSLKMLRDITKLRIETDKTLQSTEPGSSSNTSGEVSSVSSPVEAQETSNTARPETVNPEVAPNPNAAVAQPVPAVTAPNSSSESNVSGSAPAEPAVATPVPMPPEPTPLPQPTIAPAPDQAPQPHSSNEPVSSTQNSPSEPAATHEPASVDSSEHNDNADAPKESESQITRIINMIKQYLPGKS